MACAAFWSYTRADDDHEEGKLSRLRAQLEKSMRFHAGKQDFQIFQDVAGIRWGERWAERIAEELDHALLLFPIVTPSYFRSKPCRDELFAFQRRQDALGRNDLILPLIYLPSLLLTDADTLAVEGPEVRRAVEIIRAAQWGKGGGTLRKLAEKGKPYRDIVDDLATVAAEALNRTVFSASATVTAKATVLHGDELAVLFRDVREPLADLAMTTNSQHLLCEGLGKLLTGLEKALRQVAAEPRALQEACRLLGGIERRWDDVRRDGLEYRFPRIGLGTLAERLTAMTPGLVATAVAAGGAEVDNDWKTNPSLPHAAEIATLVQEIDDRLVALAAPQAGLAEAQRWLMRERLRWLQDLLYRPLLSLRELNEVRGELEHFDRVFAVLIRECQIVLGRHASHLPPLAVFRDRLADGTAGPEMIALPAGSFLMGSPADDPEARKSEFPQHEVRVPRCAIGRFPVTFVEYDAFCAATGRDEPSDQGWGRERRPVINVSWHDAQAYAAWLTERTGQGYRLPSEAEWEYAARAGTVTRYWWGDEAAERWANYDGKIQKTTEVGAYPANPWGLHDTAGNVWEWVADGWHDSYDGAPDDSSPWTTIEGKRRVLRGGSWISFPRSLRSAQRDDDVPDFRYYDFGFRLARTLTS